MAFSLFRKPPPPAEPMTWTEFKDRALPAFDEVFLPMGFERFSRMEWVETASSDVGARRMFALMAFKGGKVIPAWGYSFDYVPHVAGDTVHWHRTPKSAIFDLWQEAPYGKMDLSLLMGLPALEAELPRTVKQAKAAATSFWKPRPALADLPGLFQNVEAARAKAKQFGFDMLVQPRLAWAFTLARTGERARADDMLADWMEKRKLADPTRQRLEALLRATGSKY
ncbi:MAG: hypothetical protein HKO95_01295 [Rhodobacteraceae bacterium]|jgi:hypothetical protein|nr:hypothetical protein [Alphaproteobacteria bacterium]NNK65350.1 hypothetical protein [Paracoccaceae bacterium]